MTNLLSALLMMAAPFLILGAIATPVEAQFTPPDRGGPDRTGSTGTR